MSKITDWNEVYLAAKAHIAQYGTTLQRYLSDDHCATVFAVIYLTNDLTQAIGQDWPDGFSVISSQRRISVINRGTSSFYQEDYPICGYEYILDDMEQIGVDIDAAILRVESNLE